MTIINETSMVGVQKSKTTISQITSDKINRSIKVSDKQLGGILGMQSWTVKYQTQYRGVAIHCAVDQSCLVQHSA